MIFADDTDFPSHFKPHLEEAEKIIPVVLKKNSLTANGDKWNRQAYSREEDKWRKSKVLGSLVGDEEDVVKRMALATVQFKSCTRESVGSC
jgi:hypothetical protein